MRGDGFADALAAAGAYSTIVETDGRDDMTVTTERVYMRELPGGGFVAIDVVSSSHALFGATSYHGEVLVERRGHPRDSERPLVVAEVSGATMGAVLQELIPVALSNSAVAAAVLAKQDRVLHEPT